MIEAGGQMKAQADGARVHLRNMKLALELLGGSLREVEARLGAALSRFRGYHDRFAAALDRVVDAEESSPGQAGARTRRAAPRCRPQRAMPGVRR